MFAIPPAWWPARGTCSLPMPRLCRSFAHQHQHSHHHDRRTDRRDCASEGCGLRRPWPSGAPAARPLGQPILELLSRLTAPILSGMALETPIRTVGGAGKTLSASPSKSLSPSQSLRQRATMDPRDPTLELDENPAPASNAAGSDREERLLRFVDVLRTEQIRAAILTNAERGKPGVRRWRRPGLLLALIIMAMGSVAVLQKARSPAADPNAPADSPTGAGVPFGPEAALPGQPDEAPNNAHSQPHEDIVDAAAATPSAPPQPIPEALSLGNSRPSDPVLAGRQPATSPDITEITPPTAATTAPAPTPTPPAPTPTAPTAATAAPTAATAVPTKSADPVVAQDAAGALAGGSPTTTAAEAAQSDSAEPVLRVYYPHGSSRAEATARTLFQRIDSSLAGSEFQAQADLPNEAVIGFSEEKNHALARVIGKSLGQAGYRWKIENASASSGSPRNIIEVWLPRRASPRQRPGTAP
jgi:hypothetical protein